MAIEDAFGLAKTSFPATDPHLMNGLERLKAAKTVHDSHIANQILQIRRLVEHYYPGLQCIPEDTTRQWGIPDLVIKNSEGRELLTVRVAHEDANVWFPLEQRLMITVSQNPLNKNPWSKVIDCTVRTDLANRSVAGLLPEGRGVNLGLSPDTTLDTVYHRLAEHYEQREGLSQDQLHEISRAVVTGLNRCGRDPVTNIHFNKTSGLALV